MSDEPVRGWCEREVQQELPGLGLMCTTVELAPGSALMASSPPALLGRLRELSNRWRGARAVNVRQEAIPAAYRVFFRHIGLDPDVSRTPIEAAVLERMLDGGFLSEGLLADILTIALIDTAVPVWALDADTVSEPLGIRVSRAEERLGRAEDAPSLGAGRLVVADTDSPLAILFGTLAPGHEPTTETRRLALFAVQVAGVPALHAEESLWACRSALADARR
jgi:DNA/RNA-binding domain of Phe-tRNA-synthetase-like protein